MVFPFAEDKLLKILDEGIVFVSKNNDVQGTVTIKNTSPETVAFKVKTTSPEKFRVSPPAGMIRSGDLEKITINMVQGYNMELGSNRDKFLIMCKLLDEGETENNLTVEKIHLRFKHSAENNASIEHHRIRCIYPAMNTESQVFSTGLSGEPMAKEMSDNHRQMSGNIGEQFGRSQLALSEQVQRLEGQVRFSQTLHYIAIGLFFIMSLAIVYLLKLEIKENSAQFCMAKADEGSLLENLASTFSESQ